MSNAVATQAAGLGGKYSWMTAANASAPQKVKPVVSTAAAVAPATPSVAAAGAPTSPTSATVPAASTSSTAAAAAAAASSSWARPYVPTKKSNSQAPTQTPTEDDTRASVTMRDAMFVIEKERGHGGGRGAARGWV